MVPVSPEESVVAGKHVRLVGDGGGGSDNFSTVGDPSDLHHHHENEKRFLFSFASFVFAQLYACLTSQSTSVQA